MAGIVLGSQFSLQTALPLDDRQKVADTTARDAINSGVRWEGMTVYVVASAASFTLIGGIANSNWVQVGSAASTSVQFTLANNTAAQTITGLILDKTLLRSARIEWQAYRKATGGLLRVQRGALYAIHDDTNWTLTDLGTSSVDAGLTFAINATTGQVTVDTDDNTGTYSAATSLFRYDIKDKLEL